MGFKVGDYFVFEHDDRWNGLILEETEDMFFVAYEEYEPRWELKKTIFLNCILKEENERKERQGS